MKTYNKILAIIAVSFVFSVAILSFANSVFAASPYEYAITGSTYVTTDGTGGAPVSLSSPVDCRSNPLPGYTFVKRECLAMNDTHNINGQCYADTCLWKRASNNNFEYTINHAGSGGAPVNCSNTAPSGYSLENRVCVKATNGVCISDVCLWKKASASSFDYLTSSMGIFDFETVYGGKPANVNCGSNIPGGYALNKEQCVLSATGCYSDICLLQRESAPAYQCSDSIDNDGDGKIDYPQDPGCSNAQDNSEYNAPPPASNLVVSCYATPNPANQNQQVNFISNATGGTGSYNYVWSGACTGSSQICSNTFPQLGTQTATVTVTSGNQTNVAACSVNVNPSYSAITVQSNPATNISTNQATLNGYLNYGTNQNCNVYVGFQWGATVSYGSETTPQLMNYSGPFSQTVNLNTSQGATYHFRAAAKDCAGNPVYGQDTVFTSGTTVANLTVSKTAKNLTTGSGLFSTVYAKPSDVLMFMITLQATGNQNVYNVNVKDFGSNNLIYKDQLVVSGAGYTGDIASGINIATISAGQTVTITYQAQVAPYTSFPYGTTTLNNSVSVTGSGLGYNPASSASIVVNNTAVYGASTISTGWTNNLLTDSFLLPLIIAIIGILMWRSGIFFGVGRWLGNKKKARREYRAEKELSARIAAIKNGG